MNKPVLLFLNSNRWFSAVSHYSLQLALFAKEEGFHVVYGCDPKHSAMPAHCDRHQLSWFSLPFYEGVGWAWWKQIGVLRRMLRLYKKQCVGVVVFEGKEHTLCALLKWLWPGFFGSAHLIRFRGQAQRVKRKCGFASFLYNTLTDDVVLSAACLQERFDFKLNQNKTYVCPYATQPAASQPEKNLSLPVTFVLLGRFDPVKGHHWAIDAFYKAKFPCKVRFYCIGRDENIKGSQLYRPARDNHELIIESRPFAHISDFLAETAHFGLISSLGSEVICRVAVEFLQAGVPVIGTDAGALPEVLNEACPDLQCSLEPEAKRTKRLVQLLERVVHIFDRQPELYKKWQTRALEGGTVFSYELFRRVWLPLWRKKTT